MTKAKTNALDALRALIAERQQYEQWLATLETRRAETAEHVYNRVQADYRSRLEHVVSEIRNHSSELQLSITAMSARLAEVGKDESARRDELQEAELRAAVGEYDSAHWETLRADAERALDKIAADRAALESQLGELRSIQRLSEVTTGEGALPPGAPDVAAAPIAPPAGAVAAPREQARAGTDLPEAAPDVVKQAERAEPRDITAATRDATPVEPSELAVLAELTDASQRNRTGASGEQPARSATGPQTDLGLPQRQGDLGAQPAPTRKRKTPATPAAASDSAGASGLRRPAGAPGEGPPNAPKTLKCPECGAPNYATEWYCERCGGELATM